MSNKLVDICVNLTDDIFLGKEKNIIDEANKNNVTKMVLVGNNLDSSFKVSSLAEQFGFIATAGYHPHNAKDWNEYAHNVHCYHGEGLCCQRSTLQHPF